MTETEQSEEPPYNASTGGCRDVRLSMVRPDDCPVDLCDTSDDPSETSGGRPVTLALQYICASKSSRCRIHCNSGLFNYTLTRPSPADGKKRQRKCAPISSAACGVVQYKRGGRVHNRRFVLARHNNKK